MTRIEWRSYDNLVSQCRAGVERARALKPDAVIAIPRSGMLPASILALGLGVPLADLRTFCSRRTWERGNRSEAACSAKRVLLVDDASGFGRTMRMALAMIKEHRPEVELATCAVYATASAADKLDLALDVCAKPRLFEWNWWRNGWLDRCCVDIDGVLCPDPDKRQCKDPALYLQFLCETRPLYRITKPAGALVTGRREKFRRQTELWLDGHGITYGALAMQRDDAPRSGTAHAEHKAAFYTASPASLFIESDSKQAQLIAACSGKDVLCITTRTMHRGGVTQ